MKIVLTLFVWRAKMEEITSHYNIPLVLLSIFIAIIASYTSLNLVNRLFKAKGIQKSLWLMGGAFSLGFGIWSMHFIAMLAHHLSISVTYDLFLVILSIVLAILSCGIAFYIVSRGVQKKLSIIIGSLFIGTGIVSMHYVGMAAMKMDAIIEYDRPLLILSYVIALVVSLVALYLFSYFQGNADHSNFQLRKLGSSVLMGLAIAGMHYTGMAAATFTFQPNHTSHHLESTMNSNVIGYGIGIGMLILLTFIISSIFYDKRYEQKTSQLEFMDTIYQTIIMTANDAIILSDSKGMIVAWNKAAETIFGHTEKEAIGEKLELIIPQRFQETHKKGMERFLVTNTPHVIGKTVELFGIRKSGEEFPIELSISTLNKGNQRFFSAIIRDISERKQSENRINELVYRDPLTNYPNRRFLDNHLTMCIEQAALNKQTVAVMFIDLDRFKYINDTLGHRIGDLLLIEVAKRMEACTEKKDMLARQGGDEYILVFPQTSYQKVGLIAQDIIDSLKQPFFIEENELFITGSIGISMYPADGENAETLIKNADTSMYRAKDQGKNNYQFFTTDMNLIMAKKMKLEVGLRKALDNQEFELYYQPQVNVETGKIKGVEALIRWNSAELGMVSPLDFIPLAEETGLIIPIGKWVLKTACKQAIEWEMSGCKPVRMSVNISAHQFRQPDFIKMIEETLDETGLDPQYLELELTESIVQDPTYAIPLMEKLKSMGIKLSLDDFGTGYSSLSYLKLFPLDTLKIDKSFIKTVSSGKKDAAIVKTIINMANSLDLNVIAEGVETTDQLDCLLDKQCDEYQGYLFSRPIPSNEMLEKLKAV
jgi:diguanylate cyclase